MTRLLIEHQCPQCGAPAVFHETDRLLCCGFCKVNSYLMRDDFFRYVLPFSSNRNQNPLLVPYWRFKGTLFSAANDQVHHRFMDVSYQAVQSPFLPVSVGFRSQALKLNFATKNTAGKYLKADFTLAAAMEVFKRRFNKNTPSPIYHQEFIGETYAIIFSPFFITERVIDAVLDRPVGPRLPENFSLDHLAIDQIDWPIRFIPALCPHCGWDLDGESDSLVLLCKNCDAVWFPEKRKLRKIPFSVLEGKGDIYLPFWRIKADVRGISLSTREDLVRIANLPTVPSESDRNTAFFFWAMAFKVRPRVFLRLNTIATLAQPQAKRSERIPRDETYPVTLPPSEAVESLKITLANMARPANHYFPLLSSIQIQPQKANLVYIPFQQTAHEYVHHDFNLTVNKNQLKMASNL